MTQPPFGALKDILVTLAWLKIGGRSASKVVATPFTRRNTGVAFKRIVEASHTLKTAFIGDLCDRQVATDQ